MFDAGVERGLQINIYPGQQDRSADRRKSVLEPSGNKLTRLNCPPVLDIPPYLIKGASVLSLCIPFPFPVCWHGEGESLERVIDPQFPAHDFAD